MHNVHSIWNPVVSGKNPATRFSDNSATNFETIRHLLYFFKRVAELSQNMSPNGFKNFAPNCHNTSSPELSQNLSSNCFKNCFAELP